MSHTHTHTGKCGNCGKKGHYNRDCPYQRGICHFCKCIGHSKHNCPIKRQCETLFNVFPSLKGKNVSGVETIREYANKHTNWRWFGRVPSQNFETQHWPNCIVGTLAQNMEMKLNKFSTNDKIDKVFVDTFTIYNHIVTKNDTKYSNWFNLISRILYIKRKLDI